MFMLKLMIKCNFIKIDAQNSNSCFNLLLEKAIRHFFLNLFLASKEFLITVGWDTPSSTVAEFFIGKLFFRDSAGRDLRLVNLLSESLIFYEGLFTVT